MGSTTLRRGEALEGWGKLGEHLATGHFTSFHRVEHSPIGPLVAEVLVDEYACMPNAVDLFLGQAARWTSVRNVAFATPLGAGRLASGQPFVVVEAIDGIPLTAYVTESQRFPSDLVAAVLEQLLESFAPIHRLGLAHGAIATGRVALVRRSTGSFSARLRGFGRRPLASLVARDAFDGLSRLDAVSYASPDVARGGAIDDDADRWAIAVLGHELLTGRAPFGGPTPFARYQTLVRQQQAPSLTLPPEALALADFFAVAFAPQRNMRFASTDAMLDALLRAVTPRSGVPVGELVASIDAPLVAPPSAPAIDITLRPSVNAPARTSQPLRPSFDRTVTSEAPPEAVLAAQAAVKASVPLRHSGTLRSAIDPAVLAASQKRRRIRAMLAPWTDARIVVAFALGLSCGTFLGVLLARMVAR